MAENLDMFGWPIPAKRTKAGRPEHKATQENINKIMMMMIFGCTDDECAAAIGVSRPTLRKHYLPQLKQRTVARLQLDAARRSALYGKVVAGDVGAMREMDRQLTKHDLTTLAEKAANRQETPAEPIGKKHAKKLAAAGVAGIYAPRSAPKSVN